MARCPFWSPSNSSAVLTPAAVKKMKRMTLESAPGPLRSLAALTTTPCALHEVAAFLRELEKVSKRISAAWPEGVSAVEAIREQRRYGS